MIEKNKPIRNPKYLKWVKTLDCCHCGAPADDAHHIIGVGEGGMGTKACDMYVMPLCRRCHSRLHEDPHSWDIQWENVCKTLREAIKQGILVFNNEVMK